MDFFRTIYSNVIFRLSVRTWIEGLDLLLVVITFYLLLSWVRRRQAAFLLRGVLLLAIVLFVVTIVLPLPTFDWLVRGTLIAMLVALPVIFHPELRRLLEQFGRTFGLDWAVRQSTAESTLSDLVKAVEHLAHNRTGALVVLEGTVPLGDVVETGVPIGGQVTQDLLQAIFYGENPLHDGAVIIRQDKITAAGCVLPLTHRPLIYAGRRLGTRHRAAVGLSEFSDALVVVVSEETGEVSVARTGRLYRPLTIAKLRERLFDFYLPETSHPPPLSLRGLIKSFGQSLRKPPSLPTLRQLLADVGLLFVALLLAFTIWSFVIEQTNPARQALVEEISLRVEDTPPGTIVVEPPPASVSAIIQTTNSILPTLRSNSFQAAISLEGLLPGFHRLSVEVIPSVSQVRVLSVDPAAVDLELVRVITRTLSVTVDLTNQQNMSPAFQIVRVPVATPNQVQLLGPAPLVEQVSQVRARVSLASVTTWLQELRPLEALDEAGRVVDSVSIQPAQVQINVTIQQRLNALDVGVRAVTENSPPPGYWLSDLSVAPASVILQGDPGLLAEIGSYVDTLPVDISNAVGDLNVQVPLDLPAGVQALDSEGNSTQTVTVRARITPRSGDLVVTQTVEVINAIRGARVSINPARIDLLLSGPLPTLNEIESNPDLIRVVVNVASLKPGESIEMVPTIFAPDAIQIQAVPSTVLVTLPDS